MFNHFDDVLVVDCPIEGIFARHTAGQDLQVYPAHTMIGYPGRNNSPGVIKGSLLFLR